ncbi:MAG: ChbG/HpnK family deacetylase [Verrucomicrobiae bacterium]|nr:ChbG/HpnK family deacetylase [Verrucomicrobiae bacterium]
MRRIAACFMLLLGWIAAGQGQPATTNAPRLIIRTDDIGFCHGVNQAFKRVAEQGVVSSASVMVTTPWLDEAVGILKQHPEISVGVHLVLNSEWKEFKWGPVTPWDQVPSLVDPYGKFYGSRKELFSHRPKMSEVAKELRAQIDLALRKGLKISCIDNHMGAAIATLEFQEEMEKIAKEYHIGISRYFGEKEVPIVYDVPPEQKLSQALKNLDTITNAGLYLLVCHVGTDEAEMQAMTDLNKFGPKNMAQHRQAEADVLCSPAYKAALQARGIQLVGYQAIVAQEKMRRPFVSDKYDDVVKKALEK